MNTQTLSRSILALAIAATLAPPSHAQTRTGSDGRALDANQQVGSGGYNPEDGKMDFSQQNNIITGNVAGGRGFQDDIGYGAVGEFRDNLGSDELFNFRAESLSSSPGYLNAANVGGTSNLSVYRSFTNRSAQPQPPGLIAPEGGAFQLVPNSLYSNNTGQYSSFLDTPTVGNLAPGEALRAYSSSPSLGLRGQLAPGEALNRKVYEDAEQANAIEPPKQIIPPTLYDTQPV